MQKEDDSHQLVKFPRTRHIFDAGGGVGRDDLVMAKDEARVWYESTVSVEEKVDGSNLGISITPDHKLLFQNRSHYVNTETQAQWRQLESWAEKHPGLHQVLTPDRILFGEWLYARHSIHYTNLPDLFLAFDIYDKKKGRFLSRRSRDQLLEGTGIHTVPLLKNGKLSRADYEELLNSQSAFHDGVVEGVYVRIDEDDNVGNELAWVGANEGESKKGKGGKGKAARGGKAGRARGGAKGGAARAPPAATTAEADDGGDEGWSYLIQRAKIVRSDFLPLEDPDVTHWSRQMMVKNIVRYD